MTQVFSQDAASRRYDIDWLRTLAFGVLILYHVGMYYVADWGWHIKSAEQSTVLQDLMILTNQWRMSLLFFISGIALSLVLQQGRLSRWRIAGIRTNRLMVPLIFSMYFIVPPQLFFELKQQHSLSLNYLAFIQQYWDIHTTLAPYKQSAVGLLTWNHLWFLPYLWLYSLLALLCFPLYTWLGNRLHHSRLSLWCGSVVLVVVMAVIWVCLREKYPVTHALINDWYNHGKSFWAFSAGILLPFLPRLWQQTIDQRRTLLIVALLGYSWLLLDHHGYLDVGDELDGWLTIKFIHGMLLSINHWSWILALLGYAGRYLNHSHRFLSYTNEAILPCYIFHQTLIIVFAMQLSAWALPASIEAPLLIGLTTAGCVLAYELVRRTALSRWLFGLKVSSIVRKQTQLLPG